MFEFLFKVVVGLAIFAILIAAVWLAVALLVLLFAPVSVTY